MRRATLLLSITCAVALSLAALAFAATPLRSLVATPSDLPGFSAAKVELHLASSPSVYAKKVLRAPARATSKEISRLKREGFREGVQELLHGTQGEALSLAIVFRTAKDAKRELSRNMSADVKQQGKAEVKQITVASIPGAFAFTASEAGAPGAAGNALFAVGHCFIVVGDSLREGTAEQAGAVPLEGAPAVYEKVKHLCA